MILKIHLKLIGPSVYMDFTNEVFNFLIGFTKRLSRAILAFANLEYHWATFNGLLGSLKLDFWVNFWTDEAITFPSFIKLFLNIVQILHSFFCMLLAQSIYIILKIIIKSLIIEEIWQFTLLSLKKCVIMSLWLL